MTAKMTMTGTKPMEPEPRKVKSDLSPPMGWLLLGAMLK